MNNNIDNVKDYTEYIKVLVAMQKLAPQMVQKSGLNSWTSKATNFCIQGMMEKLGIDELLYDISGNEKTYLAVSKAILIKDMLTCLSAEDILILLCYTYDNDKYKELVKDVPDEDVAAKYTSIAQSMTSLAMSLVMKFTIDKSVSPIFPRIVMVKSEEQARILWYNGLVDMSVLCKYGYLYSEEFTDYLIDHILKMCAIVDDNNRADDQVMNIYVLLSERIGIKHSNYFRHKHSTVIRRVRNLTLKRAHALDSLFQEDENKEESNI